MGKGKRELKKTKNQQKSTKIEKENNKKVHSQTSINVTKAESHKLESKDQEIPKDRNYTKAYNITYISTTAFMLLGAFSGAIVLYIYLNSINSTSLFYKSISGTNLISFIAAYLVLNSFTFFITTSPSYLVYKNEIKSGICAYSLPTLVSFIFICCYYAFSFVDRENLYIENTPIILCIITLTLLMLYFFLLKSSSQENKRENLTTTIKKTHRILTIKKKYSQRAYAYKKIIIYFLERFFTKHFINNFEKTTYFVLSAGYSILFILGINHGEHDFFYIAYSILIPTLVWVNNTIASDINKNTHTKKSLFQFVFFSFTTSTILMPIFIYSIAQPVKLLFLPNLETKYSDRIMQILGYQDKDNKVYYIEESFIKTVLEPRQLLIKVEKYKTESDVSKDDLSRYTEYSAHCGKIYWNTGDTVVFKREHSNKFIQIPANKIFEYQGDKITCKIVKVSEETKKIANIMKNSPFKLLEYKQ